MYYSINFDLFSGGIKLKNSDLTVQSVPEGHSGLTDEEDEYYLV